MLGCLEWLFTLCEFALYGLVILGVIMVMVGMVGGFGAVAYPEATVAQQAGQGCVVSFFVALGLIMVAALFRRKG